MQKTYVIVDKNDVEYGIGQYDELLDALNTLFKNKGYFIAFYME